LRWKVAEHKFDADADRISVKFLSTVMEDFQRDGAMREKYNMVTRSSEFQVAAGHRMNVVGLAGPTECFWPYRNGFLNEA